MAKITWNKKISIIIILALLLVISILFLCKEESEPENDPNPKPSLDIPMTGFENSDSNKWTTHNQELAFLDEVAEKSKRVNYSKIGTSVEGRPLHLVRVGFPEAPSDKDIADGASILIMATQHGNEPAGREMALEMLRNLAFTEDPELIEQLKETTVLFIPTINPDGRAANKRLSAEGVDLNLDHLNLKTPEIQTVAKIVNKFHPDITIDAHERTGNSPDIMMLWPENLNVDGQLRNLNMKMVKDYLWPDIKQAGYTTGLFSSSDSKVSGGERVMTNMGALRHGLVLLTESSVQKKPEVRVDMQLKAANSVLRFYREHFNDIAEVVTSAPERKANIGENRSVPFYMNGGTNRDLKNTTILQPPPCGYLLETSQMEKISRQIELFSLKTKKVSEHSVFVPMDQPMMTVIPLLLDERANYNVVDGKVLNNCSNLRSIKPPDPDKQAQYKTDFTGENNGKPTSDWMTVWDDSSWSVLNTPNRVKYKVNSGSSLSHPVLIWDKVGKVNGDVEVSSVVRVPNGSESKFHLGFHVSGTEIGQSQNAYFLDVFESGNNSLSSSLRINRYFNGNNKILSSHKLPFKVKKNTWYNVVVKRSGAKIMAKVWPYNRKEPSKWQITVNDRFIDHGKVGLIHFTQEAVNEWAFVGVGTGGKVAPRAPKDLFESKESKVDKEKKNGKKQNKED